MIQFTVDMAAPGKARARAGKMGWYTPSATKAAEKLIADTAAIAMRGVEPFDGPVSLEIMATYRPPASTSKRKTAEMIRDGARKTTKPDADNVLKLVADALTGIVYVDDKQIWSATVSKMFGLRDAIHVTAREDLT